MSDLENNEAPFLVNADGTIKQINLWSAFQLLSNRSDKRLYIKKLIPFMSTIGRNKSFSKNRVGQFQAFLNAAQMELALFLVNRGFLQFCNANPNLLSLGQHGTDNSDFKFIYDNQEYGLEAKMYKTEEKYWQNKASTNFHPNTNFVIIFILATKTWFFARKIDNYNKLYTFTEITQLEPALKQLRIPKHLVTIHFKVDNTLSDDQVLAQTDYIDYYTYDNYTRGN